MQELAEETVKEKYDLIISVGGDGTLNQISSELIGTNVRNRSHSRDQETVWTHFGIKNNIKQAIA